MISNQMLLSMYAYSFDLVLQAARGLTHLKSLAQPYPGGNPANWVLGHILTSRCNLLAMLELDPPWDFARCRPYLPDAELPTEDGGLEDLGTILADLEMSQGLFLNALRELQPEELHEIRGENSLAEELASYAVHEAYHAGELALIQELLTRR